MVESPSIGTTVIPFALISDGYTPPSRNPFDSSPREVLDIGQVVR